MKRTGLARQDGGGEAGQCVSRRHFMESTAAALAGSITGGMCFPRKSDAAPFPEYLNHDAIGLAALVRREDVKAEDLLDAAIERVEATNPSLNAVVTKMYDEARAAIRKGLPNGPFAGVPFLVKDLGARYAGVRYTAGARLFADYVVSYDDELMTRYREAGLVTVGRTNTPEFGLNVSTESVLLKPARNPWDTERSTGGSSGGSAAAVAARMVPMAHGNDGGGSIRIPSSCCGVFGMKPSRGRMPTGPDFGEMWEGFATSHALTVSVRDSAALLDASSAPEVGAPYGIPAPRRPFVKEVNAEPGRLRIAWSKKGASPRVHADCTAAVEDAAELCESLGHVVEEAAPRLDYEPLLKAYELVVDAHTAAMLDQIGKAQGRRVTEDMVEPWTWARAKRGWQASAAEFAATKTVFNTATRAVARFLENYDVLLTPTLGTPPPMLGFHDTTIAFEKLWIRHFDFIPFTWLHNVTGLPAMSVPLFWNRERLPIGVQFAGRYADEATLYRLAGQLERRRPWRDRTPTRKRG